jgi:glycosyltransferase involved in cell wall biosynthesis
VRILMASQFYPPVVGGQERMVRNLAVGLARRGHEIAVATLKVEGNDTQSDDDIRVHHMQGLLQRFPPLYQDPQRRHVAPLPDPELVRKLGLIVDHECPDVIHAHDWLVHSLAGVARRRGVPLVRSLHDYSLMCSNKRLIRYGEPCQGPGFAKCLRCSKDAYGVKGLPITAALAPMSRRRRDDIARYLPVSHAVAALSGLSRNGLPFTVVPNFLSDDLIINQRDGEGIQALPDEPFVCFVGDLTIDKGVEVLLAARQRLATSVPFVLIGRPFLPQLADLDPGVHVLGRRPYDFVLEALERCAVAVVPSVWEEPFGLAALEAMRAGRPVVASRTGGLSEVVVDGETGLLVPPGDEQALAKALSTVLSDRDFGNRLGENGERRAKEVFSEGAVLPLIERVYHEVSEVESANAR